MTNIPTLKTLKKNRDDFKRLHTFAGLGNDDKMLAFMEGQISMRKDIDPIITENEKLKNMIHDERSETSRDIIGLKVQIENLYEFLRARNLLNIEHSREIPITNTPVRSFYEGAINAYQDVLIELERVLEITQKVGVK